MSEKRKKQIKDLKLALLMFLGADDRHYGELTRKEQSVEDLAQALNAGLDQLLMVIRSGCEEAPEAESPSQRLAGLFLDAGAALSRGGRVDEETVEAFEASLDLLDQAADFRRAAGSAQDKAETLALKDKRNKGS